MGKFFLENWTELSLTMGGIIAYFTGRKQRKSDETTIALDNIDTIRKIEKKLVLDMEAQIEKWLKYGDRLETVIERQRKTIRAYEEKYGKL